RNSSRTAMSASGSSKKRPAEVPSSWSSRPSGKACASCSETSRGIWRSAWRCTTSAGACTDPTSAETSMFRSASIIARPWAGGVGDRGHGSRVVPEQRERLDRSVIHDGVEVAEHWFEAEIVNITLRATGAAAVVEDEPDVLPKPLVRVAETRNSPLAEHVAEW